MMSIRFLMNPLPAPSDDFSESKRALKRALAQVKEDGMALEFTSEDLRGDREVVLAAVAENGLALEFASKELQGNFDVVLTAIAENGFALEYSSAELAQDPAILAMAIQQDGLVLSLLKIFLQKTAN